MQELWLLRSARRLMLIDVYMKFREDNLNGFQVIEQKRVRQTDGHIDARGKTIWGDINVNTRFSRRNANINWHSIGIYVSEKTLM